MSDALKLSSQGKAAGCDDSFNTVRYSWIGCKKEDAAPGVSGALECQEWDPMFCLTPS